MKKFLSTLTLIVFFSQFSPAQEIIPFPDLSDHHDYSNNGGQSIDDRDYAIYSEYYQEALRSLDEEADRILILRREETDKEVIDGHNKKLDAIRHKKIALLSEADLVEDLQKFY